MDLLFEDTWNSTSEIAAIVYDKKINMKGIM